MVPYKTDTEISSYIIFPRFLISLDLSNDAKVLYALLLDRAGISKKKGYIEADGTIRMYFTVEDAKAKLRRSRQVTTRVFHELESCGLIVRRKQGLGRPAIITLNLPVDKGGAPMIDEQKLYELLKDFDPAVGERMEKHFKDGAYHFDLGNSKYTYFEGASVYTVIPYFAEKGSEGIVKKLKRLMEKDLQEKDSET